MRALAATLLDILGTRAQLALVELREEGERRKQMLVLAVAAGLFFTLALLLATLFVVVLFWDSHRLLAVGAATLVYVLAGAWALGVMRHRARTAPPPFEATLRELATDRDLLGGRHE